MSGIQYVWSHSKSEKIKLPSNRMLVGKTILIQHKTFMTYTDKHIMETYSGFLEGLSSRSKTELIESLSKFLKPEKKNKESNFYKPFGAFASEKSAGEIITATSAAFVGVPPTAVLYYSILKTIEMCEKVKFFNASFVKYCKGIQYDSFGALI